MKIKLALFTMLIALAVTQPLTAEIINFSTASDSGNTAPLWIAADLGFFEKYGNTVRLVFIQGATVSISALLNNDVHMAQFSPMLAIANNIKGLDFTITMSFNQFMDNNVFGRKGITDVKQIKSLAIGRYGSSSDFMGRFLLQREGLKPESEVALLQFGTKPAGCLPSKPGAPMLLSSRRQSR
jgi:ABC-type nitrate/sulfonate/bicarbonate transport system substrate-binding protein